MASTAVAIDYNYLNDYETIERPKTISLKNLAGFLSQKYLTPTKDTLPESPSLSPKTFSDAESLSSDLSGVIDWVDDAIKELYEIYIENSEDDWDGYGAAALSYDAYFEASKILMIIPTSLPMPEVAAEPDGGIGLEWYKEKGYSFVISVNGKGIISYAGLFGSGNETYGSESFSGLLPKTIIDGLRRLYLNNYVSD